MSSLAAKRAKEARLVGNFNIGAMLLSGNLHQGSKRRLTALADHGPQDRVGRRDRRKGRIQIGEADQAGRAPSFALDVLEDRTVIGPAPANRVQLEGAVAGLPGVYPLDLAVVVHDAKPA